MTKREFVDELISKYIEAKSEYNRAMCINIEKQRNHECDEDCDVCQDKYYETLQESLMEQYDESEDSNVL